jgi:predicted nucleic acid-binding protein
VALILDTNALSALADGDVKLERALADRLLALPVTVLGEYVYGILRSRYRTQYERWLEGRLAEIELLVAGRATAGNYAEISHELRSSGRPIPSNDLWIAAAAREHDMPIVTRDRHFGAIRGVQVISW